MRCSGGTIGLTLAERRATLRQKEIEGECDRAGGDTETGREERGRERERETFRVKE